METKHSLTEAYKAARRPRDSRGMYWRPAALALAQARKNLEAAEAAAAVYSVALVEYQAAREIDSRRYAPALVAAREKLDKARVETTRTRALVIPSRDIKGGGGASLGAPFKIGAYTAQWCENPPFRYLGKAGDAAPWHYVRDKPAAWFLDADQCETVSGGVFQMVARDGLARFIPAVMDPHNDGPAMLLLGDVESAPGDDTDQARRDAARAADAAAEAYAEQERAYQAAWQAGRAAGEALAEAAEARRAFLALRRDVKRLAPAMRPQAIDKALKAQAESLVDAWREGKATAARLETGDGGDGGDAWALAWNSYDSDLAAVFEESMAESRA